MNTVRDNIPIDRLLRQYIDETQEIDVIKKEKIIDSEIIQDASSNNVKFDLLPEKENTEATSLVESSNNLESSNENVIRSPGNLNNEPIFWFPRKTSEVLLLIFFLHYAPLGLR